MRRQDIHQPNCKAVKDKFVDIYKQLNLSLKKYVDIACEKSTFSWLSALSIQKHGYALHK